MVDIETPVLIVGGAGCGLASAIFLAQHGIESWLIERHPATSPAPKAHYLNPRTMELFREIGLADTIYNLAAPLENMQRVGWYTSLGGDGPLDRKTIGLMDAFGGGSLQEDYESKTPCPATNYPQLRLEPLMHEHAKTRQQAKLNYYHELQSVEQDDDHIVATILRREDGSTYRVRAQYMIAADGGKMVGPALGIEMDGIERLADMVSVHFKADLSPWIDDDTPMIRWFNNPDQIGGTWGSGVIVAMGPDSYDRHSSEWLVHFGFQPDDPAQFDQDTIIPRLRTLLKLPDLEMEIMRMNNWQVQGVLARRFREGRIFLAGDAAHRHPPTTGLGLNSAIQDAHNLAWKLAMVLNEQADDSLLDSYETERRYVTGRNVEWALFAFQNHQVTDAAIGLIPGAPPEVNKQAFKLLFSDSPIGAARRARFAEGLGTQRIEFQALGIELGYHYPEGAIVSDGTDAPETHPMGTEYIQLARPGFRIPHAWVDRNGERISTLDLVGQSRFLLLTGLNGSLWEEMAKELAQKGMAIEACRIAPDSITKPVGWSVEDVFGIGEYGAVLVRPDGYVGWRTKNGPDDSEVGLPQALNTILGSISMV